MRAIFDGKVKWSQDGFFASLRMTIFVINDRAPKVEGMEDQAIVVLVTAPDLETGREIGRILVEKKLAACVNILSPVNSLFTWEGKLNDEQEGLLIIKSRLSIFQDRLLPAIIELHPYQVPEVLALPVLAGNPAYLDWISESTAGEP